MNIALGCDHRGEKVAYKLIKDIFLRDHYANLGKVETSEKSEKVLGAFLIAGAACSDAFDRQEAGGEPRIERIRYSQAPVNEVDETIVKEDANAPACLDYPDVAAAVAEAVADGRADKGILICGTGVGMCIVANKFQGIRAAVCYNEVAAELSRRHNDANVLCVSGEFLSVASIESLVRRWLTTPFDGGRHVPRLEKICKVEEETGL